jgi:hypothetical protein
MPKPRYPVPKCQSLHIPAQSDENRAYSTVVDRNGAAQREETGILL